MTKYSLAFNIGDKVKVLPFDCDGRVLSIYITKHGAEYQVRYYLDNNVKEEYYYDHELKSVKITKI